jgi:zinc/manganese transport system substrate-binding protein
VAALRDADALVVNGLGFEAGLLDAIEAAADEGVRVISAADVVEGSDDPHLFTDPVRMRQAAALIADSLVDEIPALDTPSYRDRVDGYLAELEALDADIEAVLADIPAERRVLITNHEVLGYFADRYGFEVLGAIIPGGSTLAEPGAADLDALVQDIDEHAVPAIFADTSSPGRLADALAAEGANVTVVELYSESLGEEGSAGDTYIGMLRTNAERIAAALG